MGFLAVVANLLSEVGLWSFLLMLFLAIFVGLRLGHWLDRIPTLRALANWIEYRRWTPCHHLDTVMLGGVSDVHRVVCQTCGVTLLADTIEHWDAATAKSKRREARFASLRRGVEALQQGWRSLHVVHVLLREYVYFTRLVGALLVTGSLILWLAWGVIGESLLTGLAGSPACRQVRLEMFFLEADKLPECRVTALPSVPPFSERWRE